MRHDVVVNVGGEIEVARPLVGHGKSLVAEHAHRGEALAVPFVHLLVIDWAVNGAALVDDGSVLVAVSGDVLRQHFTSAV